MRGNKYRCRVCGRTYDYCPACVFTPDPILDDNFCSHEHAEIFKILSKHGCNLATVPETLEALDKYDLDGKFTPEIEAHIASLLEEKEAE